MNEVQIFESAQFGQVRTIGDAEKPMFCLADLCRVLEIQPGKAKQRLNQRGITLSNTPTKNQYGATVEQSMVYIDEQNLYKLIMRSDKPQAEPFQDWVCGEVLPTIRKKGAYVTDNITRDQLMTLSKALLIAKEQIETKDKQIAEQANTIALKTQVYEEQQCVIRTQAQEIDTKNEALNRQVAVIEIKDETISRQVEELGKQAEQIEKLKGEAQYTAEVLTSSTTYTLTEIAKDLDFTSVYAFTKWASEHGVLFRQSDRWMPTAKYSGKGYFSTRTYKFVRSDNSIGTSLNTVVTEKGRMLLHDLCNKS